MLFQDNGERGKEIHHCISEIPQICKSHIFIESEFTSVEFPKTNDFSIYLECFFVRKSIGLCGQLSYTYIIDRMIELKLQESRPKKTTQKTVCSSLHGEFGSTPNSPENHSNPQVNFFKNPFVPYGGITSVVAPFLTTTYSVPNCKSLGVHESP